MQGIQGIQLDTGGYRGYRGIQGIQRDAEKYRDIEENWGYRLIQEIQRNTGDTDRYRRYRGIQGIQRDTEDTGDTGKTFLVVAHSKRQYSINLREK